jgi:hypothetical protein
MMIVFGFPPTREWRKRVRIFASPHDMRFLWKLVVREWRRDSIYMCMRE